MQYGFQLPWESLLISGVGSAGLFLPCGKPDNKKAERVFRTKLQCALSLPPECLSCHLQEGTLRSAACL